MAFRYINPGYVALLDKNSGATQIYDNSYSTNGVSFYLQNTSYNKGLSLNNFRFAELYIKFDAYLSIAQSLRLYIPGNYRTGLYIDGSQQWGSPTLALFLNINNSAVYTGGKETGVDSIKANFGIKMEEVNSFLLHAKYGDEGLLELYINSSKYCSVEQAMAVNFSAYPKVCFYSASEKASFSNVIISDEEISPKEQVIALPVSTTETDMTNGTSGIYIADAANQILLQSVDVESLIANYGASSAVTGVALVGNPAYKTAEGLASLISLSKSGGSIAEHGTINLSSDSSAIIGDSWTLEDVTIADLRDIQFGWKVGM